MMGRLFTAAMTLGVLLGAAAPLRAEFELRLGLGMIWVSPDDFNTVQEALNKDLKLERMNGGGVDLLFHPPVLPLFGGLRFEGYGELKNSQDTPLGGYMYDIDVRRFSVVAGYRLLDNIVFLGPLVTLGQQSGTIQSGGANPANNDLERDGLSYSIGLEGGVVLKKWTIGAEVSHQSVKFKGLDLSGHYARVLLGRRFL